MMDGPEPGADLGVFFEALLFIAERPLSSAELAELAAVPRLHAEAALAALGEELEETGRGLRLQRMDDAWQLVTAPEVGARLAAYAAREEARLSPAALEALAVIAYRQPCTRADVERVRGVDSDYVIRSLLHRRLVAETGRRDTPGRPILFGTTFTFLERFGLTSLDDLPPLPTGSAAAVAAAGLGSERGAAAAHVAEEADAG
jgi:segregation and condensation protein B